VNILIAIPVFNEQTYLSRVLGMVRRFADHILVIDDGSTDQTPALLRQETGINVITHPENRGYGQSLHDAFQFAICRKFDWLITMDCDEQHEPSRIPAFIQAARDTDADLISGSRYLENFNANDLPPADRRRINTSITALLNDLLPFKLTDAFCGFKAYRVATLNRFRIDIPGYAMPVQQWVQAARAGMKIHEIPVRLIYNDPNRHFGGMLDDPDARFKHYLDVLISELSDTSYFDHLDRLGNEPRLVRP
jgi:dolichol-phosphate mannosyltransferase